MRRIPDTILWTWLGCGIATALAWWLTWLLAKSMRGGMAMPGGWRMSMMWMRMDGQSELWTALMFLAMWLCMMVAMMLASALPVLMLAIKTARHADRSPGLAALVGAGYFVSWLGFGVVVYAVGRGFAALAMRSEWLAARVPALAGVAIVIAGLYQQTPWKDACLRHCRSPLTVMVQRWRPNWRRALSTGIHHGNYCVACCWSLMAIQCVLGVMSFPVMIAIATLIAAEKLIPAGRTIAAATGIAFALAGAAIAYRNLPIV
jgi:predicted metal-binding membrane protein